MLRRYLPSGRNWLVILDQFISSATNSVVLIIGALLTDETALAALGAISGAFFVQVAVARALIVTPLLLRQDSSGRSQWLARGFVLAIPVGLILALIGINRGIDAMIIAAFALPFLSVFETFRGVHLGRSSPLLPLTMDSLWLISTTVAVAALALCGELNPNALSLAWLAPPVALGLIWPAISREPAGHSSNGEASIRERFTYLGDSLLGQASNSSALALVAAGAGGVAATWQAARLGYRPLGIALNLIPVVVPDRLAGASDSRATARRLDGLVRRIALVAAVPLSALSIALLLARGTGAEAAVLIVLLVGVEYLTAGSFAVWQVYWKLLRRGSRAVRLRFFSMIAAIGGVVFGAWSSSAVVTQGFLAAGGVVVVILSVRLAEDRRFWHGDSV